MNRPVVILARTLAYIDFADLGRVFVPDLIKAIAERYNFQKLPKLEDKDKEGLVFEEGRLANKVVSKLKLYDLLVVVETASNTNESKEIIEEMLLWATGKFKLKYRPGLIKRLGYVSCLTFYSDVPVLDANPALKKIAAVTESAVSEFWHEPVHYEPMSIIIGHDPLTRKHDIASFLLARRAEARFSENKYYSEAPLPTDQHLRLLEEYERDMGVMLGIEIR